MGDKEKKLNWALATTAAVLALILVLMAVKLGKEELTYLGKVKDNKGQLAIGLPELPASCSDFKPTIGESIQKANCVVQVEDITTPFEITYQIYGMSKKASGVSMELLVLNRRILEGEIPVRSMNTFVVPPGKFYIHIPKLAHQDIVSLSFVESIKEEGTAQAEARVIQVQVKQRRPR